MLAPGLDTVLHISLRPTNMKRAAIVISVSMLPWISVLAAVKTHRNQRMKREKTQVGILLMTVTFCPSFILGLRSSEQARVGIPQFRPGLWEHSTPSKV